MRYNGLLMTRILYSVHTDLDLKKQRGRCLIFSDNHSTKKIFIPFLRVNAKIRTLLKNATRIMLLCLKQPVHLVAQSLFNRTDGTKRTNINGQQYQEKKNPE
jgi:hypothetical protein